MTAVALGPAARGRASWRYRSGWTATCSGCRRPSPLPDDLRARLRQHKAEIVALLSAAEPANDMALAVRPRRASPACRWRSPTASAPSSRPTELRGFRRSAGHGCNAMLRGWSKAAGCEQALALGWTAADLFGCDRRAPWHRLDRAGLVLLTGGHEIVELTEDSRGAQDIDGIGAALSGADRRRGRPWRCCGSS